MKKVLNSSLILVLASTLSACVSTSSVVGTEIDLAATQQEKTTIRVWLDDNDGRYIAAVIEEFQKENPNILVEFQSMGTVDSRERLKTYGPSGNGADVFQFPHDHLAIAVQEDLVYALPTSVQTELEKTMAQVGLDIATLCFNEVTDEFACTEDAVSKLYAVPMSLEAVALYYNEDLLTTLEVDIDTVDTMEKLLAAVDKWNKLETLDETDTAGTTNAQAGLYGLGTSAGNWANAYFAQSIFSAFGFRPFGTNGNDASAVGFADTLEGSETIANFQNGAADALTWMQETLKPLTTGEGLSGSVNGGSLFETGKIPFVIAGPWNIEGFKKAEFNFGMKNIPSIAGNTAKPFAGAIMAAVYKNSPHPEEAIKFVNFLASEKAMAIQYTYKGRLPALKDVTKVEGVATDPLMLAIAAQLVDAIPMPTIPQVTYYWAPAETLINSVWSGSPVGASVETAEQGYLTAVGLAG